MEHKNAILTDPAPARSAEAGRDPAAGGSRAAMQRPAIVPRRDCLGCGIACAKHLRPGPCPKATTTVRTSAWPTSMPAQSRSRVRSALDAGHASRSQPLPPGGPDRDAPRRPHVRVAQDRTGLGPACADLERTITGTTPRRLRERTPQGRAVKRVAGPPGRPSMSRGGRPLAAGATAPEEVARMAVDPSSRRLHGADALRVAGHLVVAGDP